MNDKIEYKILNEYYSINNIHLMFNSFYTDKFIELVNNNNNQIDENIFFICITNSYEMKQKGKNIVYINIMSEENIKLIQGTILKSEKIFIHYFIDIYGEIIHEDLVNGKVLYWIPWGADFYPYIEFDMYEEQTRTFSRLFSFPLNERKKISLKNYNLMKRVDTILTWNNGDFELITAFLNLNAKCGEFYYPLREPFNNIYSKSTNTWKDKFNNKRIILVGNSASIENNHVDVFLRLNKLKDKNFIVVCPLSYGDKNYGSKIIELGEKIFGSNFYPLLEFMDAHKYYKLLSEVDIVIMNHIRQQGVGNSVASIYLGKKIYLNKKSNVYNFYLSKDIYVYDIDTMNDKTIFEVNKDILEKNIKNIQRVFNDNHLKKIILDVLK